MKAFCLNDSAPEPSLIEQELPVPQPTATEVLIRVRAAGVTPTETEWYPTTHTKDGGARCHAVPGHEFSGVVAAVGAEVRGFQVGQEVYGMNDWFANGATAEYCLTQPASIAAKPQRLSHAEAASVPISALTAWQGLYDRAKLRAGERVLIHGGSGAVGVFAIQLAHRAGAQVFTTASARNADFLENLGASHVIDYKSERFEDHVGKVDVVFDAVGGETLRRSWDILQPGGRLVTIASNSEDAPDDRTKAAFFIVEPRQDQLAKIAQHLDSGELKPCVDDVVPFKKASAAYFGKLPRARERGKVVLAVVE
ncbi:MAG: NADP-dependent oxidoreductase [Chthoniobacter sp.]|uniref:NADP-dependent oxidoreductase n=1 Tax=Chthoniobacter sp. TaxID=2510640 RepID=UPI0032A521C3